MNEKANVSKELNAKHMKILEGLLKLPENRECADCKSKSLGVHITKVRSTTLDTWLPEQISYVQSMGNEKSNSHWEAELPPNYDRVGIENFIRAKYLEKRWVSKHGAARSPSKVREEKISVSGTQLKGSGHGEVHNINHPSMQMKVNYPPVINGSSSKSCNQALAKECQLLTPDAKQQKPPQTTEAAEPKAEPMKKESSIVSSTVPPKVDYATELFQLLFMDNSGGNDSKTAAVELKFSAGRSELSNSNDTEMQSSQGIQGAFTQPSVIPPFSGKPSSATTDVNNLLIKTNAGSQLPFHQQPTMLPIQQPYPMSVTAAADSAIASHYFPVNVNKLSPGTDDLYMQNCGINGRQVSGMIANGQHTYVAANSINHPLSGLHKPGPVNFAPVTYVTNAKASTPPPTLSLNQPQPQGPYDLSTLSQGMLAKR